MRKKGCLERSVRITINASDCPYFDPNTRWVQYDGRTIVPSQNLQHPHLQCQSSSLPDSLADLPPSDPAAAAPSAAADLIQLELPASPLQLRHRSAPLPPNSQLRLLPPSLSLLRHDRRRRYRHHQRRGWRCCSLARRRAGSRGHVCDSTRRRRGELK